MNVAADWYTGGITEGCVVGDSSYSTEREGYLGRKGVLAATACGEGEIRDVAAGRPGV